MNEQKLDAILNIVQEDVGRRGLRADPDENLITATTGHFHAACRELSSAENPRIAIVTGFTIPTADPPCGETDGPLGALFLARALTPCGFGFVIAADGTSLPALRAGVRSCGLTNGVRVVELPNIDGAYGPKANPDHQQYCNEFLERSGPIDFLIALERVGPNQAAGTLDEFQRLVAPDKQNRCYSMRGRDMSDFTRPAHLLFENAGRPWRTIGIGDGGNEIGMGRIPWEVIHRNIPDGGLVACRVPTDHLIIAGVSNWGACALAAGVLLLRGVRGNPELFDAALEQWLLETMIREGPLIDGVTGERTATVDGLPFEQSAAVLTRIQNALG